VTDPVLTAIAIAAPWLAAALVAVYRCNTRIIAFSAALISVIASAFLLRAEPTPESLDEALMLLFSCITLGATLVIPRRDCTPSHVAGILFILGSTLLAYSTQNLAIFLIAWILPTVPFFLPRWFGAFPWRPRTALLLSSLALAMAIALIAADGQALSIDTLHGRSAGGNAAFAFLVVAVMFRKGICPVHAWVADAFEAGPAIPAALLFNGHFGALLVAKLIVPLFPSTAGNLFPVLSYLAMGTAVYVAIRALTENSPRRLLAFLGLSQSAAILAGLESRTSEGVTGALVHWLVVSISTLGLVGIVRLLEVRFGENLTASTHFGLAEHAPRLAVFFAVFGLALVGLPGTLSFCSEDLLIHGTLMSHPLTGLLLPSATAMNAVTLFRLFARLFLGKHRTGFTVMADALPRERWILTAGIAFVVFGGLFPDAVVGPRSAEAGKVEDALIIRPPDPAARIAPSASSHFGPKRSPCSTRKLPSSADATEKFANYFYLFPPNSAIPKPAWTTLWSAKTPSIPDWTPEDIL
jgi:NADH-quinone oxidoreductase subunit M